MAWPATCVTPAANGTPRWCAGPVDWHHLARSTCHERHGRVHTVAAQRPVITPAPRRARLTRVRLVRRCADVAARDVAVERVPAFASKNNLLSRFSKLIFSIF
jgi:hypothetical protein